MVREEKTTDKPQYYSVYIRVNNSKDDNGNNICCEEWRSNPQSFYTWYENQVKMQKGLCWYCMLSGNTMDTYGKHFKKGKRGAYLEVDRKISDGQYSPDNCVLACYPCNNAKSDVFTYEEFVKIGGTISMLERLL
jgi:hypothetical protein